MTTSAFPRPPRNDLALDLQALVDAGLIEFRNYWGVRRYFLTPRGQKLSLKVTEAPLQEVGQSVPETCAACGNSQGFDEGARCRVCHVAAPPYM